jgi:uncharacterized protein (TIGR00299 family) protein
MKILYYDCFCGISGDMNLGAMIDLGIEKEYIIRELKKLNISGWNLVIKKDQRHGIKGTMVTVERTKHDDHHRHLSDIEKIITESSLDREIKDLSMKIFMKVAESEARVHGIPLDKVHFHEVGAMDSIIDIVSAAICYNYLKVDEVHVSTVELGGGMVQCEHGILPVPAPATAEILKDIPVKKGGVDFEATTPTGAAILASLGDTFNSKVAFRITKSGYGVGHKEHPEVPNLLRVFLGESVDETSSGHEAILIECNIDDMNPEFYEYISEKLFSTGASDVFLTNIIMKKGRPGIVLNTICEKENTDTLKGVIFTETTTLGVRTFPFKKDTLVRISETHNTSFGPVNYKRSFYRDREVSLKPESDDCRRIASETGLPVKEIYLSLLREVGKSKDSKNAE